MKRDLAYYNHCKHVLLQSPLFEGLANDTLDDMLTLFRRDTWRRGTQLDPQIFQERFYMLIDGRVEIMRSNPETGRNITLYILGQGDGIDIITLLTTTPHEIEPVAIDDVSLISIPIADARNWIEQHPEFNRKFLPYLGKQMTHIEDLATDLALHDTMTRLARLILRHVAPHHDNAQNSHHPLRLIHDLHDEALARMVGSVRQVVNRHLQHWRKQGILHKKNFHTTITELEALQQYADAAHPASKEKHTG